MFVKDVTHLQKGIYLELFTVVWMIIEATIAIYAGIIAGSALIAAFGIDSIIELMSGGILLWRLQIELKHENGEKVEQAEHIAKWIVAVTLILLCLYVLFTSVYALVKHSQPEGSFLGIGVSFAAVIIMPLLASAKNNVQKYIRSDALKGDITNTITCAYMAGTVLAGLLLNFIFHWWWAESIAGLVFLFWLVREAKEAFEEAREGTEK